MLSLCPLYADNTKIITLNYDKSQFSFIENSSKQLVISPISMLATYSEDSNALGLPYLSCNVLVPRNCSYKDIEVSSDKIKLFDNCSIALAPRQLPTNMQNNIGTSEYAYNRTIDTVWDENYIYTGESTVGDLKILYFKVCPFDYDYTTKQLYLLKQINLKINLHNVDIKQVSANSNMLSMYEKIPYIVVNPNDFTYCPIQKEGNLDYVIITNHELKDSFKPLAEWKNMKGVRTEIVAVEDIDMIYPGLTLQEKIKSFLYEMYASRGLQYAMLGGDDAIVPVKYCYSYAAGLKTFEMPADMYYSCFNGQFNWDSNNNGIYGETTDSIDLMPNIFLTRLPVRTSSDVEAYTEKLLSYEQCKDLSRFNNNILMCGNMLGSYGDAESKGNKLYENYIKPYWDGNRNKFYDTDHSEFDSDFTVSGSNLQTLLSRGYSFAEIITHGSPEAFGFSGMGNNYAFDKALALDNKGYTIITTNACSTNAFDSAKIDYMLEPCLSESFIRNRNSGVIAYLGCSREGWYSNAGQLSNFGASMQYESQYYKNLFSQRFRDKNFGKIVAYAKADLIGLCNEYGTLRWVQLGLNPIGDAEMPIYTEKPKSFEDCTILVSKNNIKVDTGVDSCTICVMSKSDIGASYYSVARNVNSAKFDINTDSLTLCITKQNYAPKIITKIVRPDDENETIIIGKNKFVDIGLKPYPGEVSIGYSVSPKAKSAKAVASNSTGHIEQAVTLTPGNGKVKLDTSRFSKDIISVSLFVDGKLEDSIRFINK